MNPRWYVLLGVATLSACGRSTVLHQGPNDASTDAGWDSVVDLLDVALLDVALLDVALAGPSAGPDALDVMPGGGSPYDVPLDATSSMGAGLDGEVLDALNLDTAIAARACAALKPLADKGVFTTRRSERVFFSPDLSWLVLRVHVEDPPGVVHAAQLVRIALPSGDETVLSASGGGAEALGSSGAILLTGMGSSGTDLAVFDETGVRTIATGVCGHLLTPDGSRVYVVNDCAADGTGTLSRIDTKTAEASLLATSVLADRLAVSPSGEWGAFVVSVPPLAQLTRNITLVSLHGERYAIPSRPGVTDLSFLSDKQLLFTTTAPEIISMFHIRSEVLSHVVGAGDKTAVLDTNVEVGLFGFQVSSDRNWLLSAQSQQIDGGPVRPALLFADRLDQGKHETITTNLLPYWNYQLAIHAFAFSAVRDHVVYETYDDGTWSYALSEGAPRKLSTNGMFVMSPTRDEVAIRETNGEAGSSYNLRLVALERGADVVSFSSSQIIHDVQFLPDGRGLLFVEKDQPASGVSSSRLRYISSAHLEPVVLAQWNATLLSATVSGRFDYPTGSYPVDPTGCFTIADVDGAPGPGTRLILLPE
jgi:hypothetical protein